MKMSYVRDFGVFLILISFLMTERKGLAAIVALIGLFLLLGSFFFFKKKEQ